MSSHFPKAKDVKDGLISRKFNDRLDTYIIVTCKVIDQVSFTSFGTLKTTSLQTISYHKSLNGQKTLQVFVGGNS